MDELVIVTVSRACHAAVKAKRCWLLISDVSTRYGNFLDHKREIRMTKYLATQLNVRRRIDISVFNFDWHALLGSIFMTRQFKE